MEGSVYPQLLCNVRVGIPTPTANILFLSPRVIQGGKDDQDKEEMEPVAPPSHGSKTSNKNEGKVARFAVECLEGLASV